MRTPRNISTQSEELPEFLAVTAAFTTPADMIIWLCRQYAIPAEKIVAIGGTVSTTERVGERAGESIIPVPKQYLEDDDWITFDYANDRPSFPVGTVIQADLGQGLLTENSVHDTPWERVIAYRVARLGKAGIGAVLHDHNARRG